MRVLVGFMLLPQVVACTAPPREVPATDVSLGATAMAAETGLY